MADKFPAGDVRNLRIEDREMHNLSLAAGTAALAGLQSLITALTPTIGAAAANDAREAALEVIGRFQMRDQLRDLLRQEIRKPH